MEMPERLLPIPTLTIAQQINFWLKVNRTDGCWSWTGANSGGYGSIKLNGRQYYTHRVSWFLYHSKDPGKLLVLHSCNNPSCVNPKHLFLGNNQENNQQAIDEERRNQNGVLNPRSNFTEKDVLEIRASLLSDAELARKYKVKQSAIWNIKTRRTWKHI